MLYKLSYRGFSIVYFKICKCTNLTIEDLVFILTVIKAFARAYGKSRKLYVPAASYVPGQSPAKYFRR